MTLPQAKTLPVYWVDAFTDRPFTGNPAVVVPEADGLSPIQMQQIAREVNCSETAFVSAATDRDADICLRWFTPTMEVDLCGHATVAALHTLVQINSDHLPSGQTSLQLQTRSGVLTVSLEALGKSSPWVWLTVPPSEFQSLPEFQAPLATCLGLEPHDFQSFPMGESLNGDVLISVASLSQLHGLQPDMESLGNLGHNQGWRGICVYTLETLEPDNLAHLRFFAPHCGISEDPVTGSVSVPLAAYLQQRGQIKSTTLPLILEQGDCLHRPGRVSVDLSGDRLRMGGQAVTVIQGELYL